MNNIRFFTKHTTLLQQVLPYIPHPFLNRWNRNIGPRVWSRVFIFTMGGLGAALLANKMTVHCIDFKQSEAMDAQKIDETYRKIFPTADDLHVTKEDILLIGRCILGLRHVSSEAHAHQDATQGIKYGCSINASFQGGTSEDSRSITALLDDRVREGKDCSLEIRQYENLLKRFIQESIAMDIEIDPVKESRWNGGSRFMIVADDRSPSSCGVFYGIGRLGPSTVPPERVFLLKPPTSDELTIPQHVSLTDLDREKLLRERIARVYLSRFIQFIRTEFNPNQFKAQYEWAHYEKCFSQGRSCLGQLRSTRPTDLDKVLTYNPGP